MSYKIRSTGLGTCKSRRMRQHEMKYTTQVLSRSPAYYRFISRSITEAQAHPGNSVNQAFSWLPHIMAVIKIPLKHQENRCWWEHVDRQHCSACCRDQHGPGTWDILRLPLPHCLRPSAGSASDKSTFSTKSTQFPTSLLIPWEREQGSFTWARQSSFWPSRVWQMPNSAKVAKETCQSPSWSGWQNRVGSREQMERPLSPPAVCHSAARACSARELPQHTGTEGKSHKKQLPSPKLKVKRWALSYHTILTRGGI